MSDTSTPLIPGEPGYNDRGYESCESSSEGLLSGGRLLLVEHIASSRNDYKTRTVTRGTLVEHQLPAVPESIVPAAVGPQRKNGVSALLLCR
jgi:hypothetical protein